MNKLKRDLKLRMAHYNNRDEILSAVRQSRLVKTQREILFGRVEEIRMILAMLPDYFPAKKKERLKK